MDSSLRNNFDEYQFKRHLNTNRWAIALFLSITTLYYFIDPYTLTRQAANDQGLLRIFVLVPMLAGLFLLTFINLPNRAVHQTTCIVLTVAGLLFVVADAKSQTSNVFYSFISMSHVMTILLIGIVSPYRYCLTAAGILYCAAFGQVFASGSVSHYDKIAFISGLTGITLLMGFWVLIREKEAKHQWLRNLERKHSSDIQNSSSSYFFKILNTEIATNCSAIERSFHELKGLRPGSTYLQRSVHSFEQSLQLIDKLMSSVTWRDALSNKSANPMSASRLVNNVVDDYRNIYPQFTFVVYEEVNFRIIGDEVLLARAISNLLDNAVRLHSPGTIIEISIRNQDQITIRNDGPAIPDNLENMFKYGASGNSANRGLFGLGLFLAYQICRNHSAQLSAYQCGQKATFVIRFNA